MQEIQLYHVSQNYYITTSYLFLDNYQGRTLAVWILAAKLPNSDLNFAVDFLVDFFPPIFSKEKGPKKSTKKNPPQNSPGTLFGKIPLGFLQRPFLEQLFLGAVT